MHTPEALTIKSEIRAKMRRLNRSLGASARTEASQRIFAEAEKLTVFASAHTIALFCSLPDEPDTSEAIARWSCTKRVVLPRVEGDTMTFRDCDPSRLCPGAFGICEPAETDSVCPPSEIDLILVPGVAFTPSGVRLGRGRGYYDKYMSQPDFHACRAGVCYAHQIVAELPAEAHDVPVDVLLKG